MKRVYKSITATIDEEKQIIHLEVDLREFEREQIFDNPKILIDSLYDYALMLEVENEATKAKALWIALRGLAPNDKRFEKRT